MTGPPRDRRLLFNVGVLGVSQVTAQGLNVLALLWVARVLGTEQFGVVQVGVAFSAYALLISEMGLMSLGIRDLSRLTDLGAIRTYIRHHLGLLGVLALLTGVVGVLVLPTLPFYSQAPAVFLIYLALVLAQWGMLDWVTTGLQNQKWTGIFWVARSALYAGLVALFLPSDGTRWGISALVLVPAFYWGAHVAADALLAARVVRMVRGRLTPLADSGVWRARLVAAAPIGGSLVVVRVLYNADILLLGVLADASAAGIYAAASKLVQVLVIGAEVVWKVLLPRLSQTWSTDPEGFCRDFSRTLGLAVVALTPIAVLGIQLSDFAMTALYSDEFAGAGAPLRQLVVAYPLLALGIFLGNGLIACDRQHRYLPSVTAAAVAMIGLNVVLIPRSQELGASWAVLLSALVLVLTTGLQMRGELRPTALRPLLAALAGGLAAFVVMRWVPLPHVVASAAVALAAYALVVTPLILPVLRRR